MDPIIKFKVQNQSITRVDTFHVFASSKRYLYAEFTFLTDDWKGVAKTAIFEYRGGVRQVLLEEDRCLVPWEALAEPGILKVSVWGGNRVTVGKSFVQVNESGFRGDDIPEPPTPDLFAQILEMTNEKIVEMDEEIGEAREATSSAHEAAERAAEAAQSADAAANEAKDAVKKATDAANKANKAADAADLAASRANASAESADAAAKLAKDVTALVDEAKNAAAEAAKKANEAADAADIAINAAIDAAERVNDAADSADASAKSAIDAADRADKSVSEAKEARAAADLAVQSAMEAAERTVGAENVNISAVQTGTGAAITVTDRQGVETTVYLDTLTAVNTWADVRNAVRLGLGPKLFPVGYEFTTTDPATGLTVPWVVCGHNHHRAANARLSFTMTLMMKRVYGQVGSAYRGLTFCTPQALYCAENGLAAGAYRFTVANQAWYGADNGKQMQFTLTKPVPAGGQLVLNVSHNAGMAGKTLEVYAGPTSAEVLETAVLTEGTGGTSLGTTDGTGGMNHLHRALLGSNNYAQSAIRQFLNSASAAGDVWLPQTKFDRPPAWWTTQNGFLHGLPADFLEAVQPAEVPCRTNGVYETDGTDGRAFAVDQTYPVEDRFFLLSRPELFSTWDSESRKDGELLAYYEGLTDTERVKRDASGTARYYLLRSPNPQYASNVRTVGAAGALSADYASASGGVSAACIIA